MKEKTANDKLQFYWEKPKKGETKEIPELIFEMPGFKKGEIMVEMGKNAITIHGKKKASIIRQGKNFFHQEASSEISSKSISLPGNVSERDFDISISDGLVKMRRKKNRKQSP
jgi:HSP20 family molecular chaperone IbpA